MAENRNCNGMCKKFRVTKPTGRGRYESGQGHCQICNQWIDHNGCHLRDGSSASKDSVGWFCNCCNYRVRRHPRNKKYKKKLREKRRKVMEDFKENIDPEDLHISKGQASLLKKISAIWPDVDGDIDYDKAFNKMPTYLQSEIKDNWNSLENFFQLATDYDNLNKISSIILFEKLKAKIDRVPSKQEFLDATNIDDRWIQTEFNTWEHFLELLRYDPWYRDTSHRHHPEDPEPKTVADDSVSDDTTIRELLEDPAHNVERLREDLLEYYRAKDSENGSSYYSYVEMFCLLEEYLKIIPNSSKYSNVKNFF